MELCYVLLVLGVFSVTCGQMVDQWKVQEFPNPIYQVEACGRSESLDKSWICDPNKVISEQDGKLFYILIWIFKKKILE